MKYRLLIVEDDNNIRKGLIKIINEMQLPFESIASADNGTEALKAAEAINPHIIITDIKMPSMNGLDFIEQLKASGSDAKIIILSGYSEFSFAQRAISCNVSEYLLKPIKKDKLHHTLMKAMEEIELDKKESDEKADSDKRIKKYHLGILKDILEGYQSSADIEYILENAGLIYRKAGFSICSLHVSERTDQLEAYMEQNMIALKILYTCKNRFNHIICLLNAGSEELQESCLKLEQVLSVFEAENKVHVYTGISDWGNSTRLLPDLVKQAEKALEYRIFERSVKIFYYTKIKSTVKQKPALNAYYQEIFNASSRRNLRGMQTGIDHMFNFLLSLSPLTPNLFKNAVAGYILYYTPSEKQELIINSINDLEDLYQISESVHDFKIHIKQLLYELCKSENADPSGQSGNKIHAAIGYIESCYNRNINLEEVADYIGVSAGYLSNTFKKTTGIYFSDYLQRIRIEKSKDLLMQPRYKIYEVSEGVGFLDEKYFFKVFKKLTGVTPNQYRNGKRGGQEENEFPV